MGTMSGQVMNFPNSFTGQGPKLTVSGPRELSILDPQAIPLILGFSSKTFKGPFYDSMEDSVSTTRDKVFHKQRRKIWDSSMKQCKFLKSARIENQADLHPQYSQPTALNSKNLQIHC